MHIHLRAHVGMPVIRYIYIYTCIYVVLGNKIVQEDMIVL